LRKEYKECVTNLTVSPKFRAQTQSLLGQLRSAMDFIAHDVASFCSRPPHKIYFPIATTGLSKAQFEKKLAKDWFPELNISRPDLFAFLMSLQPFSPGNEWLPAFHRLSNTNKHVKLSKMVIGGFEAAIIRFDGKPVMQIGDGGYRSLTLQPGSSLVFKSGEKSAALRGPQTVDRNTNKLLNADPALDVVTATWTEFKYDEYPNQTAIVFLEMAEREVRKICDKIEALI